MRNRRQWAILILFGQLVIGICIYITIIYATYIAHKQLDVLVIPVLHGFTFACSVIAWFIFWLFEIKD